MKRKIEELTEDIEDIIQTEFSYITTVNVPSVTDTSLTFGNGEEKKAKELKTCVLFADIRSSVALTKKHHTKTMGRLYSAFAKVCLKAAHHHGGYVRNIIGDRVMIVFPSANCFVNAVECAITINHVCNKIIDKNFNGMDFKCGIGVDYGELKIIKVGTPKQGDEAAENRGLVWTGYPANIASRLTDVANKTMEETYYEVKRNPINPLYGFGGLLGMLRPSPFLGTGNLQNDEPYQNRVETVEMTPEEFANSLTNHEQGKIGISLGKFISFEKKSRKKNYPPILLSDTVYKGYKKESSTDNSLLNKYWEKEKYTVNDVNGDVFGGNIIWDID
ncbi:adenylate/guanylate cyclase domain-containing protein [Flagellimonas olearia]|nr:adenylate/guanylate cyclase domain-containing protein [Allomuricauda olearia]